MFIDNQWIVYCVFPYTNLGCMENLLYLCSGQKHNNFKSIKNEKDILFADYVPDGHVQRVCNFFRWDSNLVCGNLWRDAM